VRTFVFVLKIYYHTTLQDLQWLLSYKFSTKRVPCSVLSTACNLENKKKKQISQYDDPKTGVEPPPETSYIKLTFQILPAASMKMSVFRDVAPCCRVVYRRFRVAYCLHHEGVMAASTSETSVTFTRFHRATTQKTAIIVLHIIYTLNLDRSKQPLSRNLFF
jgi:hypothetical protein